MPLKRCVVTEGCNKSFSELQTDTLYLGQHRKKIIKNQNKQKPPTPNQPQQQHRGFLTNHDKCLDKGKGYLKQSQFSTFKNILSLPTTQKAQQNSHIQSLSKKQLKRKHYSKVSLRNLKKIVILNINPILYKAMNVNAKTHILATDHCKAHSEFIIMHTPQ